MEICPVLAEHAALLWHQVDEATRDAEVPADPLSELLPRLDERPEGGERSELWLGVVDGVAVATGDIRLPLHDNTSSAEIDVRVLADHRRRGHGREMAGHLFRRVSGEGRTRIFGATDEPLADAPSDPEHAGRAFARTVGARPVLSEIRRSLDLTTLERSVVAALRAEASGHAAGYSLVQWVDRAPVGLVDDLALLMARMSTDVPLEDMEWEPESWDATRVRAKEDGAIARGRCRVVTAVRHDATGQLVGYTDIGVNTERPDIGYQWDTIVMTEHRGHRLGLLMKAANLELLQQHVHGVRVVQTWNAEVNQHMIAVNEMLGFRATGRWRQWQLDLGA
jgi:GNAT superfamily N-acetyltransferase